MWLQAGHQSEMGLQWDSENGIGFGDRTDTGDCDVFPFLHRKIKNPSLGESGELFSDARIDFKNNAK
jgi:hypothetical protein